MIESEIEIDYLPLFNFSGVDINVLRILPVPVGVVYFNTCILIYSFFSFIHPVEGGGGCTRTNFIPNAENNIIHTFYEKLRSD